MPQCLFFLTSDLAAIFFNHSCNFLIPKAPLADGVGTRGIRAVLEAKIRANGGEQ
jgi:hypothetical protein